MATKQTTSQQTVLDAALQYAARGWAVFPLGPNGKAPHPDLPKMTEGEGGVYLATTDLDQIEVWWDQWPCLSSLFFLPKRK